MSSTPEIYLEMQVGTATPQRLRLMLIEAALRQARRTLVLWSEGQSDAALEALIRCREIVGELIAVIPVGIPTGNAKDPLRHEIAERVGHAGGVARVGQAAAQSPRQLQALISRPQQDRAAVRASVCLVKRRDDRLRDEVGKENSLCYRGVVQRQRLRAAKGSFSKAFVPLGGVSAYGESGK